MTSLFISDLPGSLRLAKTHDGSLEEFAWENVHDVPRVNSIYLGKVIKVLPGIQGAFLDIGNGMQVFLNRAGLPNHLLPSRKTKLSDVLKPGRLLLVQIRKTAYEEKQAQASAKLRFLGFFSVCLPGDSGLHFSKKFAGDKAALRLLPTFKDEANGWIIRSAAGEVPVDWLEQEGLLLAELAAKVHAQASGKERLIWQPELEKQWLLDRAFPLPKGIYVDSDAVYENLKTWLGKSHPGLLPVLQMHLGKQTLFDAYKISSQLEKAMASRVWLPSGGMLDICQTPALVSIDVNTGKHTKARGGMDPALRTNLEAIHEIARQLRLRNLAGLVVIDLIDLRRDQDRATVEKKAKTLFAHDDAAIDLSPINRFGLLCLSRERRGKSLLRQTMRECPQCRGTGWIKHFGCLAVKIQTDLIHQGEVGRGSTFTILTHPHFANYLRKHHELLFLAMEQRFEFKITAKNDLTRRLDQYEINIDL